MRAAPFASEKLFVVKLLVALIFWRTRQPQSQLGIGSAVGGGEDYGGVGLALPQPSQAFQSLGCHGHGGGGDGQRNQHLVAVQTGVAAPQIPYLQPLNGLNGGAVNEMDLMADPRQRLQRVEVPPVITLPSGRRMAAAGSPAASSRPSAAAMTGRSSGPAWACFISSSSLYTISSLP